MNVHASGTDLLVRYTPALGRSVCLRPDIGDEGIWEDTFGKLYHVPPPEMPTPKTVLDLGANIGLTAAHYNVLWPEATVYALEMDWESFELCTRNAPDALCQWLAIGPKNGWTGYRTAGLSPAAYVLDEKGDKQAPCTTLENWLDVNGSIDFAKMDLEGTEWELFNQPGWAGRIRHLLVEVHGETYEQMLALGLTALEKLGYEVRHHEVHPMAIFASR